MIWNKLARWAGVTAVSLAIPAAALATTHRHIARLSTPTTAPSSVKTFAKKTATAKLMAKKPIAKHFVSKTASKLKSKQHKATGLTMRKTAARKLTSKTHAISRLTKTSKTGKSLSAKTTVKPSKLTSHKATPAKKTVTPVTPTM